MNRAGPFFYSAQILVMAQMDCYPTKAIMDSIADVPRFPEPPKHHPPKKNSVEKLLYITERFNQSNFRGFYGICSFCGFSRKGNTSQFRIHFTKESEGGTTCSACTKVPAAITDFYIAQRDQFLEKKGAKNAAAAIALHDALCDDSNESSPESSQNSGSNSKRVRSEDSSQPSITQALVSVHL